jgi:GNAT superfamily N-acetyltransferase
MKENSMLLGLDFRREFYWHGTDLRVGFLLPESRAKISAGIAHMSRETIRHRFFGIKNGFTERELKYLTEIDGYHHFALGVEEVNNPERGVGIMRMVRDDLSPKEAEVALLLIDDYQRVGLGTLLMHFCLVAAAERGIESLRFTYLPDNSGIVKLIKRFGNPKADILASDYVQMKITIGKPQIDESLKALKDFFAPASTDPRGP